MQSTRTNEEVAEYVERQSQYKCKVVSVKPEHSFNDLGIVVHVWNVKTDVDGSWWVVEGETVPMNLYPQEAYYFSADEVYSYHIGLMHRLEYSDADYHPEEYVKALSLDNDMAPMLFRKLKSIAALIDTATEIEDFQSIGVQCREVLIQLGNQIYDTAMAGEEEQPQESNFKKKAELFIQYHLPGSENKDYRHMIKKLTETVWDFANKITHSQSSTFYDVSSCVSLCISLVTTYENTKQKAFDLLAASKCSNCLSKKIKINGFDYTSEKIVQSMHIECEVCGNRETIVL